MSGKLTESMARYALYFSPDDNTGLAEFGRLVLNSEAIENDHPLRLGITQKAAYYGFHATLKAPMELRAGVSEQALLEAVGNFALSQSAPALTRLAPRVLSGFHALTLTTEAHEVNALAAEVVRTFEPYRAPLSQFDLDRRDRANLSEPQRLHLENYGYPYVLNEFRFHMTLSKFMDDKSASDSYHDWLTQLYSNTVTETPLLDRIAVFWQPDRSTAFTRIADFPVN